MDRLSHFRRHKKAAATTAVVPEAASAVPGTATTTRTEPRPRTSTSPAATTSASTTASAGQANDDASSIHSTSHMVPPFSAFRRGRRRSPQSRSSRSPFRDLLRPSTKRSRESPPGNTAAPVSQPESPTTLPAAGAGAEAGAVAGAGAGAGARASVARSSRAPSASIATPKGRLTPSRPPRDGKPKLPPFLDISPEEIDHRFLEILWQERHRLQNSAPAGPWARVTGNHLRMLDRYANIQPWDRNRVRLRVPPGRVDYINASPIVLTTTATTAEARPPDRYIAMQGPKKSSVDHVWRMVYEQLRSPAVIVMLTETHEGATEKCYPYYPRHPDDPPMRINQRDEFGDGFHASVRCAAIDELLDGAIEQRRILLRVHRKPGQPRARVPSPAAAAGGKTAGRASMDAAVEAGEAAVGDGTSSASSSASGSAARLSSSSSPALVSSPSSAVLPTTGPSADMELETEAGSPGIDYEDYEDEQVVYHFLYKKWPDFGVPALADVDSFFALMRLSAEKNADADNPRIVHCSAGVGRSGTFIALEHLLRELDAGVLENYGGPDGSNGTDEAGEADEVDRENEGDGDQQKSTGDVDHVGEDAESRSRSREASMPSSSASWAGGAAGAAGAAVGVRRRGPGLLVGESLLTPGAAEANDLIFTTVNQLREQRRTMVQAEPQYHFIYQVLRKLWLEKYGDGDGDGDGEAMQGGEDDDAASSEPAPKRLEVGPFVA